MDEDTGLRFRPVYEQRGIVRVTLTQHLVHCRPGFAPHSVQAGLGHVPREAILRDVVVEADPDDGVTLVFESDERGDTTP